ncbi:MAG: hypothetical protein Q9220_005968 [cf. Caloplaca sp. 1 TL-2023]
MVLETSPMSDSFDVSPNSPDPYDTDSQANVGLSASYFAQLPRPLPIIGPLFGYTVSYASDLTAARQRYHAEIIHRDLTQKEKEGIAYHTYESVAITSIGMPIAAGFGILRAYQTREGYRFPFAGQIKTEGGWWDGERIRIRGQQVLKGDAARMLMHLARGTIYGAVAMWFGGWVVSSYATTVAAVGELRDPRLQEYKTVIQARTKEQMEEMQVRKTHKDPTGQGNTNVGDLWKRHREDIGGQDDASPSAAIDDFGADTERLGGTNTGILSDAQMQSQERKQQASPRKSPTENTASTFRLEKVEKQPDSFADSFADDSSSTGGKAESSPAGSTWDRIRSQASRSKGPGQSWNAIQKEQQAGSTAGESFTFSSEDQQRQLAKDEAQNDFDARIERERRGGSFGGSGDKKW